MLIMIVTKFFEPRKFNTESFLAVWKLQSLVSHKKICEWRLTKWDV